MSIPSPPRRLPDGAPRRPGGGNAVRNDDGGHFNHALFWKMIKPGGGEPTGEIGEAIRSTFGSFADFKTKSAAGEALRRLGEKRSKGKVIITP